MSHMSTFVVLLRGINVGGKNSVSMAELKTYLEELGFSHVATYINSGNVILQSSQSADVIQNQIETMLPKAFKLDSEIIRALAIPQERFQALIDERPHEFGNHPDMYHSDVIFLMGIGVPEAMAAFRPRDGVDVIWPGKAVIYSQRLDALRTKSRLNVVMASPLYKSMTIRSWSTTVKLLELLKRARAQ